MGKLEKNMNLILDKKFNKTESIQDENKYTSSILHTFPEFKKYNKDLMTALLPNNKIGYTRASALNIIKTYLKER